MQEYRDMMTEIEKQGSLGPVLKQIETAAHYSKLYFLLGHLILRKSCDKYNKADKTLC